KDAQNQGDVVAAVYNWIAGNISYDYDKAAAVVHATDYIPSPDETLRSRKGICFDFSSLAAAMLRSQGIPCIVMTGDVSPDNIYHAWNMVYIDGTWKTAYFTIDAHTWKLIDTTFASGGSNNYIGDGTEYSTRYNY
ncbi:MAG: transglutaminase-like domain-containing protein, partial [Eggerthellaceae bacterium]|nr:transglutaminase-like domain-containing protein [Eggerthellaceae bacterium]